MARNTRKTTPTWLSHMATGGGIALGFVTFSLIAGLLWPDAATEVANG